MFLHLKIEESERIERITLGVWHIKNLWSNMVITSNFLTDYVPLFILLLNKHDLIIFKRQIEI